MSHDIGIVQHYYKPTLDELLDNYLLAIHLLSIDESNKLSKQVQELNKRNEDKDYVIKGKLLERDEQMKTLKETYDMELKILKETILDMQELIKYPKKISEL